jgi:hypothetical protein
LKSKSNYPIPVNRDWELSRQRNRQGQGIESLLDELSRINGVEDPRYVEINSKGENNSHVFFRKS